MIAALCLTALAATPVYATRQEVDEAKKKMSGLEQEKAKAEEMLKSLEGLKSDAAAYVRELDASLLSIEKELDTLNGQIDTKEAEIETARQELEAAKLVEAEQYESMKLRIKYMYEQGDASMLEMILQSEDLVQMMNRAEYIRQISEYDRAKMDEYVATKEDIAAREVRLTEEHQKLQELQEQTEAKHGAVETMLAEKNKELKNFETQIADTEGQISAYEQDLKAQEEAVRRMEEEIKRQEEEARKAAEAAGKQYNTVSLGNINFIWPLPASSRITSRFGGRSSPTEGASSNHQGVDIGASTGTSIVAAASGTVVISTYSYSAGNYIMINHGGGVYTVYMHCSQLLASEGDTVSQGQTIAKVGSTGYSTGPHLHFGIRYNGKYIDPLNYVSP